MNGSVSGRLPKLGLVKYLILIRYHPIVARSCPCSQSNANEGYEILNPSLGLEVTVDEELSALLRMGHVFI